MSVVPTTLLTEPLLTLRSVLVWKTNDRLGGPSKGAGAGKLCMECTGVATCWALGTVQLWAQGRLHPSELGEHSLPAAAPAPPHCRGAGGGGRGLKGLQAETAA